MTLKAAADALNAAQATYAIDPTDEHARAVQAALTAYKLAYDRQLVINGQKKS